MQLAFLIVAALTPVTIALYYIFQKDKAQPEPAKWLAKAFWYGVLSVFVSLMISVPSSLLLGLEIDTKTYSSFFNAIVDAFLLAAIPEEVAKFIMLYFLLKKNPFFDEKFDGIVYAVCVSMGFAGLENIMYLIDGLDDSSWISIGISRALFSIPGHFFFAVLMGYYYSLYYWNINKGNLTKILILGAPVLAHGFFDAILMCSQIDELISLPCIILFLVFINMLKKKGVERINYLKNL